MPDELFEALWSMKGGPEIVALYSIFTGATVQAGQVRDFLRLNPEAARLVLETAGKFGLISQDDAGITFVAYPSDSGNRARLEWCLEPHQEELKPLIARINSRLLMLFLKSPPGQFS